MVHVVAVEDCVAEDPEVVNTGDEVDNAKGLILCLADVSEQVCSPDLNPMVLEHEPDIVKFIVALGIEDAVLLIRGSST